MQISRGVFACVACVALAACDALLGLGPYNDVACIPGVDCPEEGGPDGTVEAGTEAGLDTGTDAYEASLEASVDAGVDAADSGLQDAVAIDGPSLLQSWAQWPMPNPDASIGGDSSAFLPNQMKYDTGGSDGGDGGDAASVSPVVTDGWTQLVWERDGLNTAQDFQTAEGHCVALSHTLGVAMRLPTRIELVSLIDFTRSPTIDSAVFTGTQQDKYWTSSAYLGDAGYWTVNFTDGTVTSAESSNYVRCVSGGAQ